MVGYEVEVEEKYAKVVGCGVAFAVMFAETFHLFESDLANCFVGHFLWVMAVVLSPVRAVIRKLLPPTVLVGFQELSETPLFAEIQEVVLVLMLLLSPRVWVVQSNSLHHQKH